MKVELGEQLNIDLLHNEEVSDISRLPGIIRIKKYMRVQWAGIGECLHNISGKISWETEN
jgi:hypothetical protein